MERAALLMSAAMAAPVNGKDNGPGLRMKETLPSAVNENTADKQPDSYSYSGND